VSGMRCKPCDRNRPLGSGGRGRNRTIDTRVCLQGCRTAPQTRTPPNSPCQNFGVFGRRGMS
jgi:hypothetical protein